MSSTQTIYSFEFYALNLRAAAGFPDHHYAIKHLFLPPHREIASVWAESNRSQCTFFRIVRNISQRYMSNDLVTDSIPYLRSSIIASCGNVLPIRAEHHSIHNAFVSQANNFFTSGCFPNSRGAVSACCSEVRTIWTKNYCSNISSFMAHDSNSPPVNRFPYMCYLIITSR